VSENIPLNSEAGQQTVDELMAKMTPADQELFKKALQGKTPVQVVVDQDGTVRPAFEETPVIDADPTSPAVEPVPLEPAPENAIPVQKFPKGAAKLEAKRQQILQDRMRRHMGRGLSQEQAWQAIQKEDFDALPMDKKFARLENMVSNTFRQLAQEIVNLGQGHAAVADAFDINYRAVHKIFVKLGVSPEEQQLLIAEAQGEVAEIRRRQQEGRAVAEKAFNDAQEKQRVEAELASAESPNQAPSSVGAEPPPEATVFGG
jgi:hypothetical protein